MGFKTDISHRAIMLKAPFLALEVPGAFHLVHDFLQFLGALLLHQINIAPINTREQPHFIT
jgi:hypothetical protein